MPSKTVKPIDYLSLDPQHISEISWYYEDKAGLDVIYEIMDGNGLYVGADHIKIPWAKLESSLKRYRKMRKAITEHKTKKPRGAKHD